MEFEWDENKRLLALAKHGVNFEKAALIFRGPVFTRPDSRWDYGEERLISIGMVEGECYAVVHTSRGDVVRIISCWKAGRRHRAEYAARFPGTTRGTT